MSRKYSLKRRAESQAETRQRIVEAVAELHEEVGPAQTSISAIAERAGVERLTVYRHFSDDASMFAACSAHFQSQTHPPDPATWLAEPDPTRRLRAALLSFYDYYQRGERTLANVRRDAPQLPVLAAQLAPWYGFVAFVRDGLVDAWHVKGAARIRLAAAIAHALRFETWQSLVRAEQLSTADAIEMMLRLATSSAAKVVKSGAHTKR